MTRWTQKTRAPGISQPSHTTMTLRRAQAKRHPPRPLAPCLWQVAEHSAHGPRRMLGGSPSARRPCGVSIAIGALRRGGPVVRQQRSPQRCWRRCRRGGPLAARSLGSSTVGMRLSAGCNAAAVRAGRGGVRSRPSGSWTTSSAPHGPQRSGTSGISACRGPLQTGASALPWCDHARGGAPLCRVTSVSSAAHGLLGTNTRRMCCAPPSRCRHSTSCASSKSAGPSKCARRNL